MSRCMKTNGASFNDTLIMRAPVGAAPSWWWSQAEQEEYERTAHIESLEEETETWAIMAARLQIVMRLCRCWGVVERTLCQTIKQGFAQAWRHKCRGPARTASLSKAFVYVKISP